MANAALIKDKLDIVEIIGERLQLQRSGKNFRGLCPFHSEKTPSFYVSQELQSFICFGCGQKGDVITFLQEFDRLTFREALEVLAERAGVELDDFKPDPAEGARRRLLELLSLSEQYYHFLLQKHEAGQPARDYLKERGSNSTIQKNFALGAAPAGWDHLTTYLTKKKGFTLQEVMASGLAVKGTKGVYDRFRNRLMFPLHDHRGRVVGFSGRLLDTNAKEAKYVNTPETELYHKRHLLYGYHQNLEAIRQEESVLIVEGEFDVLSSVQAHVKNVVAIKGSALTVEQIRLLARTVKTIILALDADSAGIAATERSIELIQPFPVTLRVLPLVGGKDPDDISRQDPKAWREKVKSHVPAFEYLLDQACIEHDPHSAEGQKAITTQLLQLLSLIDNVIERSFYLKQLSERLDVAEHLLEEQLALQQRRKELGQNVQGRPERRPRTAQEESTSDASAKTDPMTAFVWKLVLRLESLSDTTLEGLKPELFSEPLYQRLAQALYAWTKKNQSWDVGKFVRSLPAELQAPAQELALQPIELAETEWTRELDLSLTQLQQRWIRRRRQQIADDLTRLEKKESLDSIEQNEYEQLQREFVNLSK